MGERHDGRWRTMSLDGEDVFEVERDVVQD